MGLNSAIEAVIFDGNINSQVSTKQPSSTRMHTTPAKKMAPAQDWVIPSIQIMILMAAPNKWKYMRMMTTQMMMLQPNMRCWYRRATKAVNMTKRMPKSQECHDRQNKTQPKVTPPMKGQERLERELCKTVTDTNHVQSVIILERGDHQVMIYQPFF